MNIKNQKGITLMAEVITIVLFMLILGTISYSSISSLQVRALNNMYADILVIQEKAANYYLKNGEAPVKLNEDPSITDKFDPAEKVDSAVIAAITNKNVNDEDDAYYKVDFSKLLNVALNNKQSGEAYYFINTKTLTVYYNKGVTIDSLNTGTKETHYTLPSNYNVSEAPDVTKYQ